MDKQNFLWIDYTKFLGIFLVIFGHAIYNMESQSIFPRIDGLINLFHMPLFFVIMGYLFKQRSKSENYQKIIWGLLIPYILYQLIFLPFRLCNQILYHNMDFSLTLFKDILGIIFGDVVSSYKSNQFFYSVCAPCWFIMTTMQLRLLFTHIQINIKNIVFISIFSIIIFKILILLNFNLYFCIDNTLMAIPYFSIGYLMKYYSDKFSELPYKKFFIVPIILGGGAFLIKILEINGYVKMSEAINLSYLNKSLLLIYLAGIIGSLCCIFTSKLINYKNVFVDTISKNTLFIIFFHWLIFFICRMIKIQYIVQGINGAYYKLFCIFIISIINLIICYFTIKLIEELNLSVLLGKYIPKKGVTK